jgi:hypothetical protein
MEFPTGITQDMTPDEAVAFLVAFLDSEPDDDSLCAAALTMGEPLVDWHWRAVEDRFMTLLQDRPALRRMVSCCDFDESVPSLVRERLYSYVRPEDDIGHGPA